jgi:hypothetical protein
LVPSCDSEVEALKTNLVDSCFQYRRFPSSGHRLIKRGHRLAVRELKSDKDIVLARPDKGSEVVLLNKAFYLILQSFRAYLLVRIRQKD